MAGSNSTAKSSPLVWVLLLVVFALAGVFLFQHWGRPRPAATPAAAPAPAVSDSARAPAWQPPPAQTNQRPRVMVG